MPFEQRIPRPFTPAAIQSYAPAAPGVYGISNALEWIYIGQTADIRGALLTHLREADTPLMKSRPAGFVFEMCGAGQCASRQDRLVHEYQPKCNRKPVLQP